MRTEDGSTNIAQQITFLEESRRKLIQELTSEPDTAGSHATNLRAHIQDLDRRITAARDSYQTIQPIIRATPPLAPSVFGLSPVRRAAMNAHIPESRIRLIEALPWGEIFKEMRQYQGSAERQKYILSCMVSAGLGSQQSEKFIGELFRIDPNMKAPKATEQTGEIS